LEDERTDALSSHGTAIAGLIAERKTLGDFKVKWLGEIWLENP